MIKGIGIDIIELERMEKNCNNETFLKRILTSEERKQLSTLHNKKRRIEFVAGRFAAKEAFAKATGTGIGKLSFQDIKILNNEAGAPVMQVEKYKEFHIFVSISHSEYHAVAQVVLEQE